MKKVEDIKQTLKKLEEENYEEYIKLILSVEKNIDDEKLLDELYKSYMNHMEMSLLNEEFDEIIWSLEEKRK